MELEHLVWLFQEGQKAPFILCLVLAVLLSVTICLAIIRLPPIMKRRDDNIDSLLKLLEKHMESSADQTESAVALVERIWPLVSKEIRNDRDHKTNSDT